MMIQTLVENAVKHGIAAMAAPGSVDVLVETSAARIRIEVRDSGPGFEDREPDQGNGYGLRNIRERLRAYFGDDAKLDIGRDAQFGVTRVSIDMPRTKTLQAAAS
jgi:two-component system sensor histidine kinase AlgZ